MSASSSTAFFDSADRRRRSVHAAREVAHALRIPADRPRVVQDSNNTIVHLAPSSIVGKVGTSHFRDAKLESFGRELAVATHLSRKGAPVVRPAIDVPPGPHDCGNLTVTLWQYIEERQDERLDRRQAAETLRSVHDALRDFPGPLPSFRVELEDARRLLHPNRSPMLSASDRQFLTDVVGEVHAAVSAIVAETRPLHGSPHEGNWVMTAEGSLLLDFETACRGPLEWDLSALDDETLELFPEADHELIRLLKRMRSACVAAKCWVDPGRAPEVFEAAQVHLRLLRGENLETVG